MKKEQKSSHVSLYMSGVVVLCIAGFVSGCGGGSREPGPRFVPVQYKPPATTAASLEVVRDIDTGLVWVAQLGNPASEDFPQSLVRLPTSTELLNLADTTGKERLRDTFPFLFECSLSQQQDCDAPKIFEVMERSSDGSRVWSVDLGGEGNGNFFPGAMEPLNPGPSGLQDSGNNPKVTAQWYVLSNSIPRNAPTDYRLDSRSGTVSSASAGLIWKICAEGMTWNGQACIGQPVVYSAEDARLRVDLANAQDRYVGPSSWRLPSKAELQSILNLNRWPEVLVIEAMDRGFPSGSVWGPFRTAERSSPDRGIWSVNFATGEVSPANDLEPSGSDALHVRLVRNW